MESKGVSQESPAELRRKVVLDFVRDISEGRLFLSIDQKKWRQQDIDLIGNTTGRLIRDLSEYVSGAVAGEEFEFLEKQIFFSISVLRTYDTLKTSTNESRVEDELKRLESKVDSLGSKIDDMITIVSDRDTTGEKEKLSGRILERASTRSLPPTQNEKVLKNQKKTNRIADDDEGLF
ncbi:MAG: hypothetical protein OK439_00580 [Thaumarchaeota archaeon]|nr:hypothetical protein [Nitrososphaerota archaeon]